MKHKLYILVSVISFTLVGCSKKIELGLNEKASLKSWGDLSENPLLLNAITSSIHPKDSTMTVLYGNDLAYNYSKISGDGNYPTGAVLYDVTWRLQADEQWFGANVPENIRMIERIEFMNNSKTKYGRFDNRGRENTNPHHKQERVNQIRQTKMAVSP